ncbi:MAG TPA: ABC transporter permease [Daejeonella sp.]|uniref:ABC transporter permease n=1 Tax=Daejeonella sp. TaxID=2805397 RepID=UPI002ED96FE1
MIENYFKIAWRGIIKNKSSSAINIGGLAVGMAVSILISLWILDEVTFDNYHSNHKQLAQIMSTSFDDKNEAWTGPSVALPLGDELRMKYAGDFKQVSMATRNSDHIVALADKKITGKGMWVEESFPSMLSMKMTSGNINALADPTSVLISATLAKNLFGDVDPLNKTARFDNQNDFKIAGVFEDLPRNTTFYSTEFLMPWKKYLATESWLKEAQTQWNNHSFQAYVQLNNEEDFHAVSEKIKSIPMQHKNATEGKEELLLYPMDQWHLYSEFENGIPSGGRIEFVRLFAVIGVFILLLACINFMNLSTARSEKRAKEVGIRKTVGSLKSQLIGQFLSESATVALIAFVISIGLVFLALPSFNQLADKSIQLPWTNALFWLVALIFTLFTGLIAGSYPALYLSNFEPVKVLKGTFKVGRFASLPRKVLVVIQFTFSVSLIIGTIIVFKQIQFAKNRPINYKNEGLITIRMLTPDLRGHYDAIRSDLLATGLVNNMAESNSATTAVSSNNIGFSWPGKDPNTVAGFGTIAVTTDFGNTIGWQIKEGRDFSREFATDSSAIVINESAVKQIGLENIIGQSIEYRGKNYAVIGVIKDMLMESPYTPVRPTVFFNDEASANRIMVSIKQGVPLQSALNKIQTVFEKFSPGEPFNYTFNDEEYAKKFSEEQRIGNLATSFTILAIFISCLGLFGLASFVAEQRIKEIGVRKVLGATVFNLWGLLSKDFLALILISCLIAIPISFYFLHDWLQKYEYRTEIPISVFIIAIVGSTFVTLLTVSFQTVKAAIANPIKSLRPQ